MDPAGFRELWDAGRRREALDGARAALGTGDAELPLLELAEELVAAGDELRGGREAEEAHLLAAELRQHVWGPDHPHGAYARKALTDWYRRTGRLDDAERTLRASLVVAQRRRPHDPQPARDVLADLGRLELDRGDLAAAQSWFDEALAAEASRVRPDASELRALLGELCAIHRSLGRFAAAAEAMTRRIQLSKTKGRSLDDAEDLTALAELRRLEGRTGDAAALVERAERIREKARR